jgi:hypothetical protein
MTRFDSALCEVIGAALSVTQFSFHNLEHERQSFVRLSAVLPVFRAGRSRGLSEYLAGVCDLGFSHTPRLRRKHSVGAGRPAYGAEGSDHLQILQCRVILGPDILSDRERGPTALVGPSRTGVEGFGSSENDDPQNDDRRGLVQTETASVSCERSLPKASSEGVLRTFWEKGEPVCREARGTPSGVNIATKP